ncbi:MAG: AAA domain-containing protein [Thermodesulfobacteriota bacterium]
MAATDESLSLRGRIARVAAQPQKAKRGEYLFRGIEVSSATENARSFIIIPETMCEFNRDDLCEFPQLCWEGAELAAYGLQLNNRLESGAIYTVTPDSELIVEPYRPVSVTEAVEAAACVRLVDVRYRAAPEEFLHMAKGTLVHSLFGQILSRTVAGIEPNFAEAYSKARPALLENLAGSGVQVRDGELKKEARQHFDNLLAWLRENRHLMDQVSVEADRISTRLGLKGRVDAMLEGIRHRTILELKTGRIPVEDHRLQLFAYQMLFGQVDSATNPEGYVLYSATGSSVRVDSGDRHLILSGRNRVVWLRHAHAEHGAISADEMIRKSCSRKGRCFSRGPCARLFGNDMVKAHPALDAHEQAYYDRWFRLLSLEAWHVETQFARVLDPSTLAERLTSGETMRVTMIDSVDSHGSVPDSQDSQPGLNASLSTQRTASGDEGSTTASHGALIDLNIDGAGAQFSPGESVILHTGDAAAAWAVRATVYAATADRVTLRTRTPVCLNHESCSDKQLPQAEAAEGQWFLDRIPFARGVDAARQALWNFLIKGNRLVVQVVAGAPASSTDEAEEESEPSPAVSPESNSEPDPDDDLRSDQLCYAEGLAGELNDEQEQAVRDALESDTFHLIHGPPGTGKTRTLARLVQLCLDRGERVLVACPTNVALDRLLIYLMKLGVNDFLRIGSLQTVSEEFAAAVKRLGKPHVLLRSLASSRIGTNAFRNSVNQVPLVGATAYQCSVHPLFSSQRFDRVIVDEAGQLDEPSTLGPLALATRFVLGGDHLQLPPIVLCKAENGHQATGLEQSLFERLFRGSLSRKVSRLRTQYRMNTEIQEIPSRVFYDGTLVASPEAATRRLSIESRLPDDPEIGRIIDPEQPVVFVDIPGADSAKTRPEEALMACKIVERLVGLGVPSEEIGVITPYRAQQAMIRSRLNHGRAGIPTSVDTVDRFQGGEKEVIILSLTRSDGVTSFLADRKRLNVSLSRARSKLILLGHAAVLEEHPLFASLLAGLERVRIEPDS